jgi:phosphohistidine phosphatase
VRLYLIQHAQAKTKDEDPDRSISDEGRREAEMIASFAAQNNCMTSSLIVHSGKKRAEQTARIFGERLGLLNEIREFSGLAPMDDVTIWSKRLKESKEDIALVGHLPHLKNLASYLLTGNVSGIQIDFKNAGIVCLERNNENRWSLSWIVTPSLMVR